MRISELEMMALKRIEVSGLPAPSMEIKFHKDRRWRFDLCWPTYKLAVELEGGAFSNGRHVRGIGFSKDCEKYNAAVLDGWRVLRYTTYNIDDLIPELKRILC